MDTAPFNRSFITVAPESGGRGGGSGGGGLPGFIFNLAAGPDASA